MSNILSLLVIGFTAAALPGAVQTTVFLTSVEGNMRTGLRLALGAAVMDGLYLFLACFGLTAFVGSHSAVRIAIGLFGVAFMIFLGVQGIRQALAKQEIDPKERKNGGFFMGFVLVLLHLPTLLYFLGIAGTMCNANASLVTEVAGAVSLCIGAFLCFSCVAMIAWLSKRFGSKKLIRILQFFSASILIIFAIKILISLFL